MGTIPDPEGKAARKRESERRRRARLYLKRHGWPLTPENVRDRLVVMAVLTEDYAANRAAKAE